MKTEILKPTEANITRCAQIIREGGLVAYPTETVYGLGADIFNEGAVKAVYEAKRRPTNKPLIVCVSDIAMLERVVKSVPTKARALIKAFMPGALTLVLDKADDVPCAVTCGDKSIAVRIPDNAVALELIRRAKTPICAPSANTTAKPSPTLASHVKDDLDGKIQAILDGGQSKIGIESTIVDVRGEPKILRNGGISKAAIVEVIGEVFSERKDSDYTARSYSPRADVMFSAYYDEMHKSICDKYDALLAIGKNPVILCITARKGFYGKRHCYYMGETYDDYAHNLFAMLRRADDESYDTVIAEGVAPEGIGESLINRLIKSSGGQII